MKEGKAEYENLFTKNEALSPSAVVCRARSRHGFAGWTRGGMIVCVCPGSRLQPGEVRRWNHTKKKKRGEGAASQPPFGVLCVIHVT